MSAKDKHVFAVTVDRDQNPRGLARVDSLDELLEVIDETPKGFEIRIRRMNLAQVMRVTNRILRK